MISYGNQKVFDHNNLFYRRRWLKIKGNRFNGAYFYSKEIVNYFIPNVLTDRNWVTVNVPHQAYNHSIVFIHNNLHPRNYNWLRRFEDLVLVCGVESTCSKVKHLGTPIYVPLSIDVDEVKQFKCEKTKEIAFVGRPAKRFDIQFDDNVDFIENLPRPQLLSKMAQYKKIYAVGRVALEGLALGCEILPYDPRYPDPKIWKLLDSMDAVKILQEKLDSIDRR